MIHIYGGDGKGKTTASVGLLLRALGAGKKVCFFQFLKDGSSCEIKLLKDLANVYVCPEVHGFFPTLSDEEKKEVIKECNDLFECLISKTSDFDIIILDEILDAVSMEIIYENILYNFLINNKEHKEIILTGRCPSEKISDIADYITQMKKIKHPFDKGQKARLGIEM